MTETAVLDTSAIIDGIFWRSLESGEIRDVEVCIPYAALDELQAQASRNVDVGFIGLAELKKIRLFCELKGYRLYFYGPKPSFDDIRLAKKGRIDGMIRDVAREVNGTLYTADYVLYLTAEAEGIKVKHLRPEIKTKGLKFESFFDEKTLSLHLKEGVVPLAKRGGPGSWELVQLGDKPLTREELEAIETEIHEASRVSRNAFLELKMSGASVIQLGSFRIAVARPPFSDGLEITIVRPIVKLTLEDYNLSKKLMERLGNKAEGVIIAGPPGSGKSTLASSIAEYYMRQGKIVKTFESPRDLQVPPAITQYGPLEGEFEKTAEILLLVRPDFTIYDEVRKTSDFNVFADMRLAGVGMVGVVHASGPVDAVQRFIGRMELGMIPHIIDTIIFVKAGKIQEVLDLNLVVRTPTGMVEEDLARPLVEVRDFETGRLTHEIYTFGEENVIVPIAEGAERSEKKASGIEKLAIEKIAARMAEYDPNAEVELLSGNKAVVKVGREAIPRLIGRKGENIMSLEESLGIRIDVKPLTGEDRTIVKKEKKRRR
ncbi:MAG: PINc/VapC family ATPase [Conexivisphaerales archaeon]|jgi:ATPase